MNLGRLEGNEGISLVDNGTVDYLGRRANKKTTGGWLTTPLIFGAEMCERMAAFGVGFNLVPYLTVNLHLSKPYAANMATNSTGTAFLTPLLGGFIADTYLGRHKTIAIFGSIQFLGLTLITLFATLPTFYQPPCNILPDGTSQCKPIHGTDLGFFYVALYLINLGTGGIKACVSAFGADQFDVHDPMEMKHMTYFFNWFFFFISMGALFAVTVLIYIQDRVGRGWGYGVLSCCMLVAMAAFACGRRFYRYSPVADSPFTRVGLVICTAFKKRSLVLPSDPATMLNEKSGDFAGKIEHTNQFLFLSKAAIVDDIDIARTKGSGIPPFQGLNKLQKENPEPNNTVFVRIPADKLGKVDSIKRGSITITQVEEVKVLIRLLPILVTTFLFWTVYAQMTTFTITQATVMDRWLGSFQVNPGNATVLLQLSIMSMIAFYDRIFVPVMRTFTGRPQGISILQRIGSGLVFSILGMVAAALVEQRRRNTFNLSGYKISMFWLLPQYFLVGTGEAFTYIGQLEFFYHESPTSMRTIGTALCLCTLSIGFFTSSFLVDTVDKYSRWGKGKGWLANDLNQGKLDRFYGLLAFLSIINFFVYLLVARWYKYRSRILSDAAIDRDFIAH